MFSIHSLKPWPARPPPEKEILDPPAKYDEIIAKDEINNLMN